MFAPKSIVTLPDGDYKVITVEDWSTGPHGPPPAPPTPFQVQLREFVPGGTEDVHGNKPGTLAGPVAVPVTGWAPTGGDQPKVAGYDGTVIDVELFAPPALVVNLQRVTG